MIRTAAAGELAAIRDLFSRANDGPYDLAAVAEEKCFGAGVSGPPRPRVFEEGRAIRGVAVSCGPYLRILIVDRGFRRRGIGAALLHDAQATIIGAEPGNYFVPGVSDPHFFLRRGFRQTATTWDLRADLGLLAGSPAPGPRPRSRRSMLEFIAARFGPVWRFEAERARIAHFLDGIGFAVAEGNNQGLGTFGPMGVDPRRRGEGHGRALLLACLGDLRREGFDRAIIPWTDQIDFYRRGCGAEPAHHFVILRKQL